jgi:hypothetical protein
MNTPRTWEGRFDLRFVQKDKVTGSEFWSADSSHHVSDIKNFIYTIEDEAVRRTESVTLLKMSEKTGLDKDIIKLTAKHLKQILDMSSDKHLREWIVDYINLLNNN